MSRRLRPIIQQIDVSAHEYRLRDVVDSAPVSPAGSLLVFPRAGRRPAFVMPLLSADGTPITDSEYDTATNGPRVVDSPPLSGTGIREWVSIEVLPLQTPANTSRRYRVHDGDGELWWDGAAWSTPVDDLDDWNTYTDLADNLPALGAGTRSFRLRVWLQVGDDATEPPTFEAFAVAYKVRDQADEDDALLRTVKRAVLDGVRCTGVARFRTDGSDTWTMSRTGGGGLGPILQPYDFTGVLAVFDLTADPDETSPLSGTYTATGTAEDGSTNAATWEPDSPPADGSMILMEFEFRPNVVVQAHRDGLQVKRMPQVTIFPAGGSPTVHRSGADHRVRRIDLEPPTSVALEPPQTVQVPLDVIVLGDKSTDARRLGDDMRKWVGVQRDLVSPETGRVISLIEIAASVSSPQRLSGGVSQVNTQWQLEYKQITTEDFRTENLVRASAGGRSFTLDARTLAVAQVLSDYQLGYNRGYDVGFADGETSAPIAPVGVPDVEAPSASTVTPKVGEVVTIDVGTYGGSAPVTADAQRQVSADGSTGWSDEGAETTGIANGGTFTYTPAVGDVGEYLRWAVTPTNAAGDGTLQTTDVIGPIIAAVPVLRPQRAGASDQYLRTIATAQLTDSGSPDYAYDGTGGSVELAIDEFGYDGTEIEAGDTVGELYCWDATRDQGDGTVTGVPGTVRYDGTARGLGPFSATDHVTGLPMPSQTDVSMVVEFTSPPSFDDDYLIVGPGTPGGAYTTGVVVFVTSFGPVRVRTYDAGTQRTNARCTGVLASTDYILTVTVTGGDITPRLYLASTGALVDDDFSAGFQFDLAGSDNCIGGDVGGNEPYPAAIQRIAYADGVVWSTGVQDAIAAGTDPTGGDAITRSYDGLRSGVVKESDTDLLIYNADTGGDVTAETF